MKLGIRHPVLKGLEPTVVKTRDAIKGEDHVKSRGDAYLPRLASQLDDHTGRYEAYKKRANFLEATKRTAAALVGAVMRKPPTIEDGGFSVDELVRRMGGKGRDLQSLSADVLREDLQASITVLLVDAAAGVSNAPPRVVLYDDPSVINFLIDLELDEPVLVVLSEEQAEPGSDPIEHKKRTVRRVLRLVKEPEELLVGIELKADESEEATLAAEMQTLDLNEGMFKQGPIYVQEEWIEPKDDNVPEVERAWVMESRRMPVLFGGEPMRSLPVVPVCGGDADWSPVEPPLAGVAGLNFSHYLTSADLEHGRHYTAIPQAWAAGFAKAGEDDEDEDLVIGGETAWISDDPQACCGYLEFAGAGLKHLVDGLRRKEE